MNVLILAAGEGTRLRPYTENRPKPLIPFLGTQLINYSLALLDSLEVSRLVINGHYLSEQIESFVGNLQFKCKEKYFSLEQPKILGSAGAIREARKYLIDKDSFLLMNGDELILPEHPYLIKELYKRHQISGALATLLVMQHPLVGTRFGGAWCDEHGHVKLFSKTNPGLQLQPWHYLGVAAIHPRIEHYLKSENIEENILYETLTKALASGESVQVFNCSPLWYETGNPDDFLSALTDVLGRLESKDKSYPIEHLKQVVSWYGQGGSVVERGQSLEERVKRIYFQIKAGEI